MAGMSTDVWIIGGTSGIGAAVAALLHEECNLSFTCTDALEADVRSEEALDEMYHRMGLPTYVVYSAGINALEWVEALDFDVVRDLYDVNVFGFMRLLKVMSRYHVPQARSVVAVTSDAARRPMRTSMAYCSSKAALDMAIKQGARELAPQAGKWGGIRVNGVAPGMTAPTGMSDYIDRAVPEIRGWSPARARRYEESQNPMGAYRIAPAEVAVAIKYLLVDAPHAQTGSIMEVNCGR